MRTRPLVIAMVIAGFCTGWLAGCASTEAVPPMVKDAMPQDPKHSPVEEAMTVPTAEIMPEEIPAAVQVASAPLDAPPPMTEDEVMDLYKIGPTDVLEFRSFDDETLNTTVTVRHDGMISLPWIPDVMVAGYTRDETTAIIREAYQNLYYEAEVSVQIVQASSKTYTVMGDVTRPAEFPYLKPINLLDAIVSAGGLRVNQRGGDSFVGGQGQLVKAFIFRGTGEDRTTQEYDLRNLERSGSHPAQTLVLPGDTIFIPEGVNLVYVLGDVGRPGIQPLSDGMTLLQLLASVSGFNESTARLKQVVLIRAINGEETEVKLLDVKAMLRYGGDFVVQPGDIIYVPRKRLTTLGEFVSRATGVVTPILGVTSQALGLYSTVYDTLYTQERIDLLYNSPQSNQLQTNLQLLEAIRQVGSAAGNIAGN